ncbi:hypothetical protein, partial [Paraburkholderia caledonica]|uniref:hypothetical protein n=1 Tax=Paraburkholderia caledonica TaxID=134536 RepID=UPI001C4FA1B6
MLRPQIHNTAETLKVSPPNRLRKYTPSEAASLRLSGSRREIFAFAQFQREFNVMFSVLRPISGLIAAFSAT